VQHYIVVGPQRSIRLYDREVYKGVSSGDESVSRSNLERFQSRCWRAESIASGFSRRVYWTWNRVSERGKASQNQINLCKERSSLPELCSRIGDPRVEASMA
jgi:hypothetical protein